MTHFSVLQFTKSKNNFIKNYFLTHLGGLEVKLPNSEKWQKLGHLPGAIFINTGELLSVWTNNLFPALVRVTMKFLRH